MATLSVHHKIANYTQWRAVFDEADKTRRKFGETSFQVYRSAADPLEITVLSQWSSADQAKAYATSPELKSAMQNAGVVSQPEVAFLEAL
jgi:quinol monooxygenase YgiN